MQRHLLLYLLLLLTTVSSSGQIEFHFYNKDHLGNVREVVDTHGNVEQVVHYYPSGTPFTDGSGEHPDFQEYLYSGKELDKMHGFYYEEYDDIPEGKKVGDYKLSMVEYKLFCDYDGTPIKRNRFKAFNMDYCNSINKKEEKILNKSFIGY